MQLRYVCYALSVVVLFGCTEKKDDVKTGAETPKKPAASGEVKGEAAKKADEKGSAASLPPVPDAKSTTPEPAGDAPILPPDPPKDAAAPKSASSVSIPSSAVCDGEWGTLKGRFVYDGSPPTPEKLKVDKDLQCCGKYLDEIVDQGVVVGDGGGLANVYVYVRDEEVKIHPDYESKVENAKMDHKHCRYQPHALTVWAGKQSITFGNVDEIPHAVAFTPFNNAAVNNTLNQNATFDHLFETEEKVPVEIKCGVHPWEKAFILPRLNPYAAVSGPDGSFEIKNLPAGEIEFQIWHERSGFLVAKPDWKRGRVKIEIAPGDNDLGEIKIDPKLVEKKM